MVLFIEGLHSIDRFDALYERRISPYKLPYRSTPASGNPPSYINVSDQLYMENRNSVRYLDVNSDGYAFTYNNSNSLSIGARH